MKIIQASSYCVILFFTSFFSIAYAKKILLTGGAGFIGSHVAQQLLERGDSVIIIDNMNDGYHKTIKEHNCSLLFNTDKNNNLLFYAIDICDSEAMEIICMQEQPDVICHLAARAGVRQSINDPHEYFRSNNNGTLSIFEVARKCGVPHIVSASSSSVYGVRENGPFRETDPVDKQSSPYGMTKRCGELLAYVYHHLFGISITSLRFFTVYGPRGRIDMAPFIFMDAIDHAIPITVFGDGNAIRDFTYIDDIVDGIIKAIDTPLGYEIINLGRGEPVVLRDFITIIENIIDRKAIIEYVSSFAGDVPQTHADIEKAKNLLGYVPQTSLLAGIEKMYTWYKNEYSLMDNNTIKRSFLSQVYVFDSCFH